MNRLTKRSGIVVVSAITFLGGVAPVAAAEDDRPRKCDRIEQIEGNIQDRLAKTDERIAKVESRMELLTEKLAERPAKLEKKLSKLEARRTRIEGHQERINARWDRVVAQCGVPEAAEEIDEESTVEVEITIEEVGG